MRRTAARLNAHRLSDLVRVVVAGPQPGHRPLFIGTALIGPVKHTGCLTGSGPAARPVVTRRVWLAVAGPGVSPIGNFGGPKAIMRPSHGGAAALRAPTSWGTSKLQLMG